MGFVAEVYDSEYSIESCGCALLHSLCVFEILLLMSAGRRCKKKESKVRNEVEKTMKRWVERGRIHFAKGVKVVMCSNNKRQEHTAATSSEEPNGGGGSSSSSSSSSSSKTHAWESRNR